MSFDPEPPSAWGSVFPVPFQAPRRFSSSSSSPLLSSPSFLFPFFLFVIVVLVIVEVVSSHVSLWLFFASPSLSSLSFRALDLAVLPYCFHLYFLRVQLFSVTLFPSFNFPPLTLTFFFLSLKALLPPFVFFLISPRPPLPIPYFLPLPQPPFAMFTFTPQRPIFPGASVCIRTEPHPARTLNTSVRLGLVIFNYFFYIHDFFPRL